MASCYRGWMTLTRLGRALVRPPSALLFLSSWFFLFAPLVRLSPPCIYRGEPPSSPQVFIGGILILTYSSSPLSYDCSSPRSSPHFVIVGESLPPLLRYYRGDHNSYQLFFPSSLLIFLFISWNSLTLS